jgi:pimeloyl-ACP methyl ester carboxylesterase
MSLTPQVISLRGHSLSYVESGAGEPTVLFVHGLLGSHSNWADLIHRLDGRNRVVVPDLFGHGASENPVGDYSLGAHAATLRDLIDRLGIEQVTVVGHSLGGGISLEFCYLFPERVERLVLVGSGGLGREVIPALRAATLPGAEWVLPALASGWVRGRVDTIGKTLAWAGWRASNDMRAVWEGFARLSDADSRRAFLSTTRAVIDVGGQSITAHDYLPDLVDIPVLVVWGTNDMVIPVTHAERAKEAIPGCRVEIFEGAGHYPHLDDPERFAGLLRDFITTTAPDDDHGQGVTQSAS